MYQGTIFEFKVSHFLVFVKVLKIGIFRLSKRPIKMHVLAIFLHFRVVFWIPQMPAKDNFDTLNGLSFQVI